MKRAGIILVALLAIAAANPDVDPFYAQRAREAGAALATGDAQAAVRLYRIACFGMLDTPVVLGGCLGRLAIAEARADDREGFADSFRRLAAVEERFHGFAQSDLTADERAELAERAGALVTQQEVALLPSVAAVVEERRRAEIAALPPKERIRRLEKLAAEQPGEVRWKIGLAQAELDRGEPKAALERIEKVDAPERAEQIATLRGTALAQTKRCPEALAAFATGQPSANPAAASGYIGCLHDAKRDAEARAFAAGLPDEVGHAPAVQKAVGELPEPKPEAAEAEVPASTSEAPSQETDAAKTAEIPAETPAETPTDTASTAPAPEPVEDTLPPLDEAQRGRVEAAREALATTSTLSALERHIAGLEPIAEARAGDSELQRLLATLAYRASDWPLCVSAFVRSGSPEADPPLLRFYRAVCEYETGDRDAAAAALGDSAQALKRTPFVDRYLALILGEGASN